jgi:hypothetical protein
MNQRKKYGEIQMNNNHPTRRLIKGEKKKQTCSFTLKIDRTQEFDILKQIFYLSNKLD